MIRYLSVLECTDGVRPCDKRECRYWLNPEDALEDRSCPTRSRPNITTGDTCALDVAGRGEHSFDAVGTLLGLSHARVQQIEQTALSKLYRMHPELRHIVDEWTHPRHRFDELSLPDDDAPAFAKARAHTFDRTSAEYGFTPKAERWTGSPVRSPVLQSDKSTDSNSETQKIHSPSQLPECKVQSINERIPDESGVVLVGAEEKAG